MRHLCGAALALSVTLAVPVQAASTKVRTSWKSPEAASLDLRGKRVAALVMRQEKGGREDAETTLARELVALGIQGIPTYTIVPADEMKTRESVKARLHEAEIVAVVVMKEVGSTMELTENPAMFYSTASYNTFWGYYDSSWTYMFSPSYVNVERVVTVETLVYDLQGDKLVWAGMSESTNPKMVTKLVKDLVAETVKEMKKQGLVRPRP